MHETGPNGESIAEAFERGTVAGEINARLAAHDHHFDEINGSLDRIGQEMHEMTLATQRLGDQAIAREILVTTTATALKESNEAHRLAAEQTWTPVARLSLLLSMTLTAVSLATSIYFLFHH